MKDSSASYFYTRTVRVRKHTSFSLTQSQEFDIKKSLFDCGGLYAGLY